MVCGALGWVGAAWGAPTPDSERGGPAGAATSGDEPAAVLMVLLLGVVAALVLVGVFWAVLRSLRRPLGLASREKRRVEANADDGDAWSEAGRRAEPVEADPSLPRDDSEDETWG